MRLHWRSRWPENNAYDRHLDLMINNSKVMLVFWEWVHFSNNTLHYSETVQSGQVIGTRILKHHFSPFFPLICGRQISLVFYPSIYPRVFIYLPIFFYLSSYSTLLISYILRRQNLICQYFRQSGFVTLTEVDRHRWSVATYPNEVSQAWLSCTRHSSSWPSVHFFVPTSSVFEDDPSVRVCKFVRGCKVVLFRVHKCVHVRTTHIACPKAVRIQEVANRQLNKVAQTFQLTFPFQ